MTMPVSILMACLLASQFNMPWLRHQLNGRQNGVAAGGSCASYLICQNFETPTTGYDNGETWNPTGTVDPAYTGVILRGTQSCHVSSVSSTRDDFAASSDVYAFCDFYLLALPASQGEQGLRLRSSLSGGEIRAYIYSTGQVIIETGVGGCSSPSATSLVTGTHYYLWVEHHSGGTDVLAISTTTTKPSVDGSGNVYLTCSGDVGTLDQVRAESTPAGSDSVFDHILVSTSVIGNNP